MSFSRDTVTYTQSDFVEYYCVKQKEMIVQGTITEQHSTVILAQLEGDSKVEKQF